MENNNSPVSIFNFQESEVRIVSIYKEPWFVAKDLCDVLSLVNVARALDKLDEDEKGVHSMNTPGGKQEMSIVSESGMYSLVLKSRKKQAKIFKKWITSEVLPSIRKTGQYSVGQQKAPTIGEILQTMVTAYQQHEQRLLAVEEDSVVIKQRLAEQQETLESTVMLAEANANELQRFKNGHGYWYSIVGYMEKHGIGSCSTKQAAALGRKAAALCKQMGIAPEKINDPRFGTINTYPEHILAEII
ncbi:MAG: hypothetical protein F6K48_28145 [Okeania sp. SIO3H1]|uniref:BRO-N domain-containing protein n=1 Tax=Okeania sp. SIO1I7 TaxID=2607772 RepID=UPI0013C865C7|nr:BRO family protein [Okeania sp. SIO1I7]NEN92559.1 hypothetical protein [Okeania sp. SIO3H1]NET30329.1 hypothetical protein [Okeania sp. SIO1I7]